MRNYRRILLTLGMIVAAGAYLLWPSVARILVQDALRSAQRQGARISWEGLSVDGLSVSVDSFAAWIPGPPVKGGFRPPIKVDLERSTLRIKPSSLILLDPYVEFSLKAYGGTIDGSVSSPLGKSPRLSADIKDVNLSRHEQLRALGLDSAVFWGLLKDIELTGGNLVNASFDVSIKSIEISRFPSLIPIKLEPLKSGMIQVRGSFETETVDLSEVKLISSYGSAEGTCKALKINQPAHVSADGNFKVTIGESLFPTISPFLPMLSNNVLQSDTRQFNARLSGSPCSRGRQAFGDLPLGALCIKFIPTR